MESEDFSQPPQPKLSKMDPSEVATSSSSSLHDVPLPTYNPSYGTPTTQTQQPPTNPFKRANADLHQSNQVASNTIVSRCWSMDSKHRAVVTFERGPKLILSTRPLPIEEREDSNQHCDWVELDDYEAAFFQSGLDSMMNQVSNQSHTVKLQFNQYQEMVFSFETQNNTLGLRMKIIGADESDVLNQGIFINLDAANKLNRWFRYIAAHLQVLQSQYNLFGQATVAIVDYIKERFSAVNRLLDSDYYHQQFGTDFLSWREKFELEVRKALDYINTWGLKTDIFKNISQCSTPLNLNSVFINAIGDIDNILIQLGTETVKFSMESVEFNKI